MIPKFVANQRKRRSDFDFCSKIPEFSLMFLKMNNSCQVDIMNMLNTSFSAQMIEMRVEVQNILNTIIL